MQPLFERAPVFALLAAALGATGIATSSSGAAETLFFALLMAAGVVLLRP